MLAIDLITRRPALVKKGDPLSKAAGVMAERDVGSVIVANGDGSVVGILTDRDLALHMAGGVEDALIEDVMTPHPVSVDAECDVEACLERMAENRVRRVVVMDPEGRPKGVVSLDDVLVHLGNTFDRAAALIRAEIAER